VPRQQLARPRNRRSALGKGSDLSPPRCPSRLWGLLCGPGVVKRPLREADDLPQLPRLIMHRALPPPSKHRYGVFFN
jgi:hypothetical protein